MRIGLQAKYQMHNGTFPAADMEVLWSLFGIEAMVGDGGLNAICWYERNKEVMFIC